MIKIEQWKQIAEEFGEDAYQRVTNNAPMPYLYNHEVEQNISECSLKPIIELIEHDIDVYGINTYLMWYLRNIVCNEYTIGLNGMCHLRHIVCDKYTRGLNGNSDLFTHSDWWSLERKTSAELPFDLDRAKRGDVVECFFNSEWQKADNFLVLNSYGANEMDFCLDVGEAKGIVFMNGSGINILRMKYPEKLNRNN